MSLPVVLEPGSSWGTRFSAYRSALAAAQKPGAGVPAYMRWVNRGAARVVAAACAAFGWTPNFVSFISVCFSTVGLVVLVACDPAWWTGLIVGTALAVGFMFDSADGQVSRVTGASSKTGEWVDHVADAFRSPAIHFCTAAAVMVYRPESWWLAVVALVYGWVTSGQFMSQILAEQFVRAAGRKQTRGDDMVFTQMIELRGSRPVPRMPYEITPEDMGWHLLLTNPVCHPTMLATREIMDRVGGYRSVPAEDYDLWMRVASAGGRIRRIAPWGLLYRIHPGQVTGNASWRSDSWKNPEQARAFADLSVSLTGQELPRLVSLVSLPRDEAERELDRFVQVYTQGVASRPATSRRALERRLNARAAWVRSHLQGEQS